MSVSQYVSTPVSPPAVPTADAHVVQFYTDDSYLITSLRQFVRSALQAREAVILVMTREHQRALQQALRTARIDTDGASEEGRFYSLDAVETLGKFSSGKGVINRGQFQNVIGSLIRETEKKTPGKRVYVFGEMVAVLWAEGLNDAALQLEQLWNELATTHHFYLRCAYPASGFHGALKGEPYTAICAEHSKIIPA